MDDEVLPTFAAYQRAQGLSPATIRNRHSILSTLQRHAGKPLLQLDLSDLLAHIGRPGVTNSTRRTERAVIQAFYAYAIESGLVAENPSLRLPAVRVPKGKPRPFTLEQVEAMLRSGAYRRTRAMILLGYYQGFRVSSIAAVHGRDIDLLAGTITTVGKGGKVATLPLHPVIAELAKTMPRDDWWFPARQGQPGHISGRSVTNLITLAKKRAGITNQRLTPHSLRHGYGTDLVGAGVDVRVVQELLMHESLSSTQIYTGITEARKADSIRALRAIEVPERSGRHAA